ncbi:MAG: 50S ribosomal protein L15 [Caldiserica bacterium]|nr:50S ribosomal protein L15 [Caldisericota bacterium]MDH7563140.1 50S ribosomal protein L15 [Caldisericota bacterium]
MKLHNLNKLSGIKKPKRVGRGPGSGHGKTSTYGHKGQKARSGGTKRLGFEGGQIPLYRRLPQRKGFKPLAKTFPSLVNLSQLNIFEDGTTVTKGLLYEKGLIRSLDVPVKILGNGELKRKLIIQAESFSQKALEKIKQAGAKAEVKG